MQMTSRDFCYWLQGVFEVAKPETLNSESVSIIKRHLNMVFAHEIDPSMGDAAHQETLQTIHDQVVDEQPVINGSGMIPGMPQRFKC